jgi:hypothetical protein
MWKVMFIIAVIWSSTTAALIRPDVILVALLLTGTGSASHQLVAMLR